ncbi:uncharacterized protein LOC144143076 [Haemaphysalis longicornis]
MPSGYQHYILRGFSEELDLRPLHLVDALPPARICSACGHVSKRTGALLCGHFLCGLCYQQCGPDGGRTCPFDGEACPEESVQWRVFPDEELLEKQVNCWNKANGCSVTTTASELPRHFYRECEHHSTFCPKCSTKVLCKTDYSASLALHMHIRLGKGEVDEYLQWPFQKKVVLSVVHPKTGEKHEQHIFPSFLECYSMPTTAWNQICYSNRDILLSNLECWGYVKDDQLQLRVALVG